VFPTSIAWRRPAALVPATGPVVSLPTARRINGTAPAPAAESAIERSPEIFTALVEQIGLRVIPARGPLQFVIIDSVQKPKEN
jgi:uncharacterized protein (TIGR03435 family)